ncbi:MAG: DUF1127 domain-containing protein [Sulfitobacter sp.]
MAHAMIKPSDFLAAQGQARNLPLLAEIALRIAYIATKWDSRARSRKALAKLDAHELRDIGITPGQARVESAKAFWLS